MKRTLSSVSLKNFKRHEDLTVNFTDGMTAIRGPNWAGKTTVLHAILFALGGVSAVPDGKKKIPRRNQNGKTEVVLTMSDGFSIKRTLTAALVLDDAGQTIASSHTAVNEWVEQNVFGMDAKRAQLLFYAQQSETAALLTLGAPALNRLIEDLTEADFVEETAIKASEKARVAQAQLSAMGAASEDDIHAMAALVSDLSSEEKVVEQSHKEYVSAVGALQTEHQRIRAALHEAQEHNSKVRTRTLQVNEQASWLTQKQEVDSQLEGLVEQDVAALASALAEVKESLSVTAEVSRDLARLTKVIGEDAEWLKANDTVSKKDLGKLQKACETAEAAATNATVAWEEAKQATKKCHDALKQAEQDLLAAKCSACGRAFDDSHVATADKEIAKLRKALAKAVESQDALHPEVLCTQEALKTAKAKLPEAVLLAAIEIKRQALQKNEAELDELRAWCEENFGNKTIDEVTQQYRHDQTLAEIAWSNARTSNASRNQLIDRNLHITRKLDAIAKVLATLPEGDEVDAAPLIVQESEALQAARQASQDLQESTQALAQVRSQLKAAVVARDRALEQQQRRRELEFVAERYGGLAKWLRTSKAAFLGEIWDGILAIAGEFVSQATEGYATALGRSDDGDFSVVEDGEEGPMVGASGGMKSICATGLRIGLDSLLPQGMGFMLLDEPSSELDESKAASMAGALRAQNRQVILVTHRQGEEFASDQVVVLGE